MGLEQGRTTLDAVRAAQRLQAAAVPPGAKVAIMGYSQGGQAAAAAAEYQPTYAPEMNLVAAAAGGVPADLVRMGQFLDGSAGFGFLMMAALGLDTAYPELGGRTAWARPRPRCRCCSTTASPTSTQPLGGGLRGPKWLRSGGRGAAGHSHFAG